MSYSTENNRFPGSSYSQKEVDSQRLVSQGTQDLTPPVLSSFFSTVLRGPYSSINVPSSPLEQPKQKKQNDEFGLMGDDSIEACQKEASHQWLESNFKNIPLEGDCIEDSSIEGPSSQVQSKKVGHGFVWSLLLPNEWPLDDVPPENKYIIFQVKSSNQLPPGEPQGRGVF